VVGHRDDKRGVPVAIGHGDERDWMLPRDLKDGLHQGVRDVGRGHGRISTGLHQRREHMHVQQRGRSAW
jgi:hypothetical protein